MTFTSKKYVLYITLMFLVTAGISACSQEKKSEAKSTDIEAINVTMYKNPDCQCCSKWAAYMEENGFAVTENPSDELASIKKEHEVPDKLGACHTALIEGYVVEGHVPVDAINKLLKEQPNVKGIAVPGMPAESPGMTDTPSPVDVYFFNGADQVAYFDKF